MLYVFAQRHLSLTPSEADLLAGVARVTLCCSSAALLLTCDPSPGSGHQLLALASNWWEWDGLRFLSL